MLIGYNTNGFANHALPDALELLAELGYQAVSITPDVCHLPPFSTTGGELRETRRRIESLGLAVSVETGARFILDPRRKHRPNLLEVDAEGRRTRVDFLIRCTEIAAELGAGVVSIWAGRKPAETPVDTAWSYLESSVAELCDAAARLDVKVAFEPEPGMLLETLAEWERLRDAVAHPALGLTLDTGHIPCTEQISTAEAIRRYRGDLVNVHLDDVRDGIHEHLQIGEGELDWPEILAELESFPGVAAVELSRHSHDAARAAAAAIWYLREVASGRPTSR